MLMESYWILCQNLDKGPDSQRGHLAIPANLSLPVGKLGEVKRFSLVPLAVV